MCFYITFIILITNNNSNLLKKIPLPPFGEGRGRLIMKKLFTFLLALIASVGIASAQNGTCGDNLTWTLSDSVLTISGTGAMTSSPFRQSYSSAIKTVIINDGVTSIGGNAFYNCSSLTSVTIPNSVTSIGEGAFVKTGIYNNAANWENGVLYINDCLIKAKQSVSGSYIIKESTRLIGEGAFGGCSLTSITIPNSVTSIGRSAFYECYSLSSVTIPNSVTSIGGEAFVSCFSLTSINVDSNNPNYSSVDGVLFSKDKTTLIRCPERKRGAYTIPNSVTSIGDNAFHWCDALTSITIPNSVTSIGHDAFWNCNSLSSVTIPNSVTWIGDGAFEACSSLTSVTIGNSVTSIGSSAFLDCSSLTSVTIGNSVTSIGSDAFRLCDALTAITIPNSVTSIGHDAFVETGIYNNAANWENGVLYINDCLIEAKSVSGSYIIKEGTRLIGDYAFWSCSSSLTSVTIGNSVTSIGDYAFSYCSSLTSITIPNSVTSIGEEAFLNCSLTSVTFEGRTPPLMENEFYNDNDNCSFYVPCGTKEAYVTALNENNTIDESRVIEKSPYTYSIASSDNTLGSVTITQEPTCTAPLIFRADAAEGYQFTQWSDGNTDNPRSLILTQDTTLKAEFEQIVIEQDTIGAPSVKPVTSTEGYDFYVAFMPNGASKPTDKDLKLQLFVNSREANRVRLEYADGSTKDYNVPAGGTTTIDVDPKKAYWEEDKVEEEKVLDKGVRVYSLDKKPMTVYSGNQNGEDYGAVLSFDGAHVLPKEALGQEYVIQSANDDYTATEFVVMSTRPGITTVTVELNVKSRKGNKDRLAITFRKAKQIYIIRSKSIDPNKPNDVIDLSGSTICADAPVAVWSGNQFAVIPNQSGMTPDHAYDQLLPVNRWGQEFIVPMTGMKMQMNELHIISLKEGTNVTVSGVGASGVRTKAMGALEKWKKVVEAPSGENLLDSVLTITANNPIQVYLYTSSAASNIYTENGLRHFQGDPSVTMISPLEFVTDTTIFSTYEAGNKTSKHQLVLWAKQSVLGSLQLNGTAIGGQLTQTVPGMPDYKFARIDINPGTYTLTAAERGFGGYVCGLGEGQAYLYPIGYTFNPYQDTIIVADSTGISDIIPDGQDTIPYIEVQPDGEITIDITDVRIGVITIVTIGTESGQVHPGFGGNYNELENTRVVMEYVLNPFGQTASPDKWYAFAVPFKVDMETGITRKYGNKSHVPGVDFMILEYDSELRSRTGSGWKEKKSGLLEPGHFYMLGIEGNCNRWLFEKVRDAAVVGDKEKDLQHYAHGNSKNDGWHGLGNTTLEYVDMSFDGLNATYVYTYDNQYGRYNIYSIEESILAVGQPFFTQGDNDGSVAFTPNNGKGKGNGKKNMPIYAPSYDVQPSHPRVLLTIETEKINATPDRLYITLHDDNQCGSYRIGRDFMRMDKGSKQVPNFWCPMADGTQLSAHGVTMPTTYTTIPLGIFTPAKGEYTINAHMRDMDDYIVELYCQNICLGILMQGVPFRLEMAAGISYEYSIRISRRVSTDLNPAEDTQCDKDNKWYDVLGRPLPQDAHGIFIRKGEKIIK